MRALKKALTLLMIMAAMLTAIFIAGRYGWKLGGYYAKEYDGKPREQSCFREFLFLQYVKKMRVPGGGRGGKPEACRQMSFKQQEKLAGLLGIY